MQTTVSLSATASYGFGGKQYIARITGRDAKFTFAREFVGRKGGTRNESAEYDTDEPGLYMSCDIDKRGNKNETYYIVYDLPGYGLTSVYPTKTDMMSLAKRLDSGSLDWAREALTLRIQWAEAKDQEEEINLEMEQFGLTPGKTQRKVLVAAMRKTLNPENEDPKAAVVARIKGLMAEFGVTLSDLQ